MFKPEKSFDMSDLLKAFETALTSKENSLANDNNFKRLSEANEKYNELLEKGVIKKRGFQLRGIEDMRLLNCSFNVSQL